MRLHSVPPPGREALAGDFDATLRLPQYVRRLGLVATGDSTEGLEYDKRAQMPPADPWGDNGVAELTGMPEQTPPTGHLLRHMPSGEATQYLPGVHGRNEYTHQQRPR